jgi:peptidoglycan/xylan/chitin deacetylase (PgdA/CDA1 family)
LVGNQHGIALVHPFLCRGNHPKPEMGNEVREMGSMAARSKIVSLCFFSALAIFMYGGSSFLGKETAASLQSALFHRGVPQEFAYLDQKQNLLVWNPDLLTSVPSSESSRSLPVIYYHGIFPQGGADRIGWETFREQMFALKRDGYQTIRLDAMAEFLKNGTALPEKSFLLTFDDGRKDSYYPVDPVLRALNFNAVMFVITSNISERDDFYLSESELKEMVASGRWELGSHGRNIHELQTIGLMGQQGHPLSNLLWNANLARLETQTEYEDRIQSDLAQSRSDLETRFGIRANSFAFPYGDMGQGSSSNISDTKLDILRAVHATFTFAFYQPWEETIWRNYPGHDTFLIRRMEVKPSWTAANLVAALNGSIDKPLHLDDRMQQNLGWSGEWGQTRFTPGKLILSAAPDTTGATAFLDGTSLWGDNSLTLSAHLVRGESVSLLARGDAYHNYIYCSFGRHGVSYGEHMNGRDIQGPNWNSEGDLLRNGEFSVTMSIYGDRVQCSLNGVQRLQTRMISSSADHGRVGISVWGSRPGESELEVSHFVATTIPSKVRFIGGRGVESDNVKVEGGFFANGR